ncbi:MAG: flagellar hook basal-body protein [Anaerolineaceae bacterium]|nr:flagellar hook basal-body protein [Anaerolineaceae bacterium]
MTPSLFYTLNLSSQDMINRIQDLNTTSDNLANMNTPGFKTNRTDFQELLNNKTKEGVTISANQTLTYQGTLRTTNNPLDWAVQGDGYFAVKLPNGATGYTRDGQMQLDSSGQLVTASGSKLVWSGTIPQNTTGISIDSDGTVEATLQTGAQVTAGTVQLAKFINPGGLLNNGNNVYLESLASGKVQMVAPGTNNVGTIQGGAVEQSNVDTAHEMSHMMLLERNFQMSSQAFQQTETMISEALSMHKD